MTAFDKLEDKCWIETPNVYSSYNEVPSSTKWLLRLAIHEPPQSEARLEVCVDQSRHLLPGSYIAPLMLLSIQELSCMAESFSKHVDPRKRAELWRNIHFIWRLQECLLSSPTMKSFTDPNRIMHPLLERWIIRLIHGMSNSKTKRKENSERLCQLYLAHCGAGKLDEGAHHHICCIGSYFRWNSSS
jgi:hypothetical protein